MSKEKILVAMSGGVDSSTVALKMLEDGYDVEGVTLDFGKFCSKSTIVDAQNVAKQLKIKHHVLKCEQKFESKVVEYFVNEYISGRTPNPCVKCNREIKFYEILKFKEKINADYLATGHYAKITNNNEEYWLEKGVDLIKDQSYFLSHLKYSYLKYIKFPLENMEKPEVRKYAKKLGLIVAEKSESQDICFTGGLNYKNIINKYHKNKKGDILHVNGKKLGEHDGIINYTCGQRKGLGIGYTEPLFVVKIEPIKNIVYVGSKNDLFETNIKINNINFLNLNLEFEKEYKFDVKLRSTNNPSSAKVIFYKDNTADVSLINPSRNISAGQICCFYDDTRVVASGYIL